MAQGTIKISEINQKVIRRFVNDIVNEATQLSSTVSILVG